MVKVEMVYVNEDKQTIQEHLSLNNGATIEDAINSSTMSQTNPEIRDLKVGVFAKIVPLSTILKTGDRIEFYRALKLDPKEKRRLRAKGNS